MNNTNKFFASLVIFLIVGSLASFKPAQSNNDLLERIITNLDRYNKLLPQEKLYLHTDKPYYIAGEDLFYKAYIVNALFLYQESNTELVHVELRGKNGTLLRQKIKAKNGSASGSIILPDSLSTGSYTLIAYTNWMRNFSDDFVFNKQINIYQPEQEILEDDIDQNTMVSVEKSADISFFPEGGNLVNGLTSKVGFKAIDEQGRGIPVNGTIVDQTGAIVTTFNSLHAGIGSFILKPVYGKSYSAKVNVPGIGQRTFDMPEAFGVGVVMQTLNTRSNIKVTVQTNIKESSGQFLLVAQTKGQIYYSAVGSDVTKGFLASIPKSELPSGITQLTLFGGDGAPLCERLVFVDGKDNPQLAVNQNKAAYTPREKVRLSISLAEFGGNKSGDLSVSVTNRRSPDQMEENIQTYMLLSSDLRGRIQQPQFYFDDSNPYATVGLDNLLLTQGWRRFIWTDVLDKKYNKPTHEVESGLLVKGKLVDTQNLPLPNQEVLIAMPNQLVSYTAVSDENGRIERYIYDYSGTEKIIIMPVGSPELFGNMAFVSDETSSAEIVVDEAVFADTSDKQVKETITRELENNDMMQAFDVVTYKKVGNSFNSDLINSKTNYEPLYNASVNLEDYINFPNMMEVFREIVPYANIILNKGRARLYSQDQQANFKAPPLFFVNGAPTTSLDYVLSLNPADIESIGIINAYKSLVNMGLDGEVGLICINSKQGRVLPVSPKENNIMEYGGFTLSKEFYSPKYNGNDDGDRIPDFRSLLYWNPEVKTNESGEAVVEFYTSDEIGSFEVDIQGVASDGTPLSKISSVTVSVQ